MDNRPQYSIFALMSIEIKNSTIADIDEIFRLYNIASEYQRSKNTVVVWPQFNRSMVETEIVENRQFKLLIEGEIACIWAITFTDPQIWEDRNVDNAIYIHRIATNPNYRGQNFVLKIVAWAKIYCVENKIYFIRLDTIGNNTKLITHYTNAGFTFLGMNMLKNTSNLPPHYATGDALLFEIDLRS